MTAKELISDVIPYLRTSDTGLDALNWMEVFRISHLPIVNNEVFLGLITDSDIYDLNIAEEAIGNHNLSLMQPYVYQHQHLYEVIEIVSRLKLTIVPVLDAKKKFLGVISINDIAHSFAHLTAIQTPGGIIVLELALRDYSLADITQIIEGNNAKILSLYVSSPSNSSSIEITIKVNKIDLTSILQTFYRKNYRVKNTFSTDNKSDLIRRDRFESFLNYLNI
ncbi:MAG: hypothetical protein CSA05_00255 [Bacteroidia bacterium]|nr:MAG: hypothetical protein CSA05_00255 [Bacteroidia bacterium]